MEGEKANYREGCPLEAAIYQCPPSPMSRDCVCFIAIEFRITFRWRRCSSLLKVGLISVVDERNITFPAKRDKSSAPTMWRSSVDWSFWGNKKKIQKIKKSKFSIIIFMFTCFRRWTIENFPPEIYHQFKREIPTLIHGSEPLNLKQMMNRSVFYSIAHRHNIIVMLQVGHMKQHIWGKLTQRYHSHNVVWNIIHILTKSRDSEPSRLIITSVKRSVQQWAGAHQVAFEPNEVDPHGDCAVGVAAKCFNPVHQVGTELVASFQHAQHHDVMVPQVIHDVSGQTFCPGNNMRSKLLLL